MRLNQLRAETSIQNKLIYLRLFLNKNGTSGKNMFSFK